MCDRFKRLTRVSVQPDRSITAKYLICAYDLCGGGKVGYQVRLIAHNQNAPLSPYPASVLIMAIQPER